MVAPPRSSAQRTGEDYKALLQEQHTDSAARSALPEPRPAAQAPAHIKVEVGLSPGPTTALDKVGVPSPSPSSNKDSETDRLHQEQHRSDAAQGARSPPDSAAQVPAVLKDEVGARQGTTTSVGEECSVSSASTSVPKVAQATDSAAALDLAAVPKHETASKRAEEGASMAFYFQEQRLHLAADPQDRQQTDDMLAVEIRAQWSRIDWTDGSLDSCFMRFLIGYEASIWRMQSACRSSGHSPDLPKLLNHELRIADGLEDRLARGQRKAILDEARGLAEQAKLMAELKALAARVSRNGAPDTVIQFERQTTSTASTTPSERKEEAVSQGKSEQTHSASGTHTAIRNKLAVTAQTPLSKSQLDGSVPASLGELEPEPEPDESTSNSRATDKNSPVLGRTYESLIGDLWHQHWLGIEEQAATRPAKEDSSSSLGVSEPAPAQDAPCAVTDGTFGRRSPLIEHDREPPDRSHRDAADGVLTAADQRQDTIDAERYADPAAGHTLAHANSSSSTPSNDDHRSARAQDEPASAGDVVSIGNLCRPDRSAATTWGLRHSRQQAQKEGVNTCGSCHSRQREQDEGGDTRGSCHGRQQGQGEGGVTRGSCHGRQQGQEDGRGACGLCRTQLRESIGGETAEAEDPTRANEATAATQDASDVQQLDDRATYPALEEKSHAHTGPNMATSARIQSTPTPSDKDNAVAACTAPGQEGAQADAGAPGHQGATIMFGNLPFPAADIRVGIGREGARSPCHRTSTSSSKPQSLSTAAAHTSSSAADAAASGQGIQFGDLPPMVANMNIGGVILSTSAINSSDLLKVHSQRNLEQAQTLQQPLAPLLHRSARLADVLRGVPPDKSAVVEDGAQQLTAYAVIRASKVIGSRSFGSALGSHIAHAASITRQQQASASLATKGADTRTGNGPAAPDLQGSASVKLRPKKAPDKVGSSHAHRTFVPARSTWTPLPGPTGPGPPTVPISSEHQQ
ncbi:hypothetical protein OC835_007760, partial [Tilletia horrida]